MLKICVIYGYMYISTLHLSKQNYNTGKVDLLCQRNTLRRIIWQFTEADILIVYTKQFMLQQMFFFLSVTSSCVFFCLILGVHFISHCYWSAT